MKTILLTFLLILLTVPAFSQTFVEFQWTQPDSTAGTVQPDETICCKSPISDGGILKYEVFTATPTDTTYWGFVNAPHEIATDATASIPFDLLIPTSIAVRAVDINNRTGLMSNWSEPFTVDPGPPESPGTPTPIRIYFGG